MNLFQKLKSKKKGFSVIEILSAIALFALIFSGLVSSALFGQDAAYKTIAQNRATFLAEEGVEAVRNIRDHAFTNLVDGTYGLAISGNQWVLSGSQDTNGIFTRQITVATVDSNTKRVTSHVSWTRGYNQSVTLITDMTRWASIVTSTNTRAGMLVYGDASVTPNALRYKTLSTSGTWSAEQTVTAFAVPLNRPIRGIGVYASKTRNEKIVLSKYYLNGSGDDQYIYATVWNGNTSTWGNTVCLGSWGSTVRPEAKNYDGDYLNNGDFLVVYSIGSATPQYRTWNGTAWTGTSACNSGTASVNIGANPDWIIVKNRPGTNEAMVAVSDSGEDTNAYRWTGSGWSSPSPLEHGTAIGGLGAKAIDFEWSPNTTTTAALMYNEAADTFPNVRIWNSTAWGSAVENATVTGSVRAMELAARPTANEFLSCAKSVTGEIDCLETNFTPSWIVPTNSQLTTVSDIGNQRSFDLCYERVSGSLALVVYSGGSTPALRAQPKYRTYDPNTNTFGAETTLATVTTELETVTLVPNPINNDIMVLLGAGDQDVSTIVWNGTSDTFYSSGGYGQVEHGVSGSGDLDFWYDFAWDGL